VEGAVAGPVYEGVEGGSERGLVYEYLGAILGCIQGIFSNAFVVILTG
jgi:hypothetical protein